MGKNKEEFMKDREQKVNVQVDWKSEYTILIGELEETKHLLSQCKRLMSDVTLLGSVYFTREDLTKEAENLLTKLKDY